MGHQNFLRTRRNFDFYPILKTKFWTCDSGNFRIQILPPAKQYFELGRRRGGNTNFENTLPRFLNENRNYFLWFLGRKRYLLQGLPYKTVTYLKLLQNCLKIKSWWSDPGLSGIFWSWTSSSASEFGSKSIFRYCNKIKWRKLC